MKINQAAAAKGEFIIEVLNPQGEVLRRDRKRNMITNNGLSKLWTQTMISWAQYCHVGTGTTPVRDEMDGTFAQTGTTVTRSTGTGTFSAGDVGRVLRWASGEQARITAYTSGTEVTVAEDQTVAADTVTKWRTERTALATRVKDQSRSTNGGTTVETRNATTGTHTYTVTYIFPDNTVSQIYTEVGISDTTGGGALMNSIVLLDSPVTVGIGEILRITYVFSMADSGPKTPEDVDLAGVIAGWPYVYDIASISSTSTYFDLVTTAPHHYITGGKINIAGAERPRTAITSIASTVSDFTVTTGAAHGLNPTDTIIIEDSSIGGYNGPWTVATTPTADTFTVTSAANPGAATGGTVRLTNPTPWYDGEWTVASVPNSTTVRVTSAMNAGPAGQAGTVQNNLLAKFQHMAYPLQTQDAPTSARGAFSFQYMSIALYRNSNGVNGAGMNMPAFLTDGMTSGRATKTVVAGENWGSNSSFYVREADNYSTSQDGYGTRTNSCRVTIGSGNFSDIRAMSLQFGNNASDISQYHVAFIWLFEELQRKDDGWTFNITLTRKITRSFPA